jgi:protein involved in polysaccharide export with SLBB domain
MVMQPGFTVPPSGQVDLSLNQNLNRTSSQSGTSPVLGGQSGIVALQQIQQQCLLQCQRNTLPQLQVQCQQQCQQLMQQQMQQLPQQVDSQKTEFGSDKSALPGNAKAGEVVELSEVERMMSNDTPADGTRIQSFAVNGVTQFGYSYFQGGLGGFASLSDVPVGPDYIVGTGDRIVMTAWGSLEGTYELDVNRNGEITLPRVGTVKVQGVSFGQLPGLLRKSLGRVFKDFELSVALGRVRLMKVYLVGDVVTPGDYIINSFSTVMNALTAAGGPTKNGTLRNIQIWREGKLAETIDLYDFFLKGDKSRDIRLQTGDTVFVPHIGAVAGIAGNVRRPAIYELKNEKTLKDLLGLANGVAPTGYLQRVQVNRVDAHNKRIVADFNIDPKADGDSLEKQTTAISIQDLDLVKVFHIDNLLRGYARLEGYVLRPGDYALRPGMKLAELLKEDNLLPEYADGTAELMRFYPPDLHAEVSYFSPAKALANDPAHNIELKEFDRVKLFSRWDLEEMPLVRVVGEVQWPGDYRLLRNMTVRELLLQAGNPKLTAYLNKAEVVRVKKEGGAVTSFPIAINLGEALKGNPQDNISLEALDELVVRRIPNWREETDRYVTINGEVRFPGTYPIFKGERLSDLILRTGGYTDKAYLFGAKFTRRSVQKLQQERMAEVIAQMEKNVTIKEQELAAAATTQEAIAATKLALDGIKASMQKMKTVKAEGRIAIRLEPLDRLKKSPADLELMGGDVLDIPQSTMAVTILGEVASPTTTIWLPGKDVSDYLDMAGGPTNGAETGEMYVIMADGSVRGKMSDGAFSMFRSGGFMSVHLHAGDTVVVPQKLERVSWMKELKDISQILANIAVTAGVPLAIIKR